MQYKNSKKIIIDKRKLETLIRLGCPISVISDYIIFDKITKTNDEIIDENLETLLETKTFDNWGGQRNNSGRKQKIKENNQDDNQDDNQDAFQVVDKDKDKDSNKSNKSIINKQELLHLGEMNLVKLTEEENKKVMAKCHSSGRPDPTARYVLAIRKVNAWMATGTKATERYKPANKTHYGLFADGNWVLKDIEYDIDAQRKFCESRDDWLESINYPKPKGVENENK